MNWRKWFYLPLSKSITTAVHIVEEYYLCKIAETKVDQIIDENTDIVY